MARHARERDARLRAFRGSALTLIWLGGLVTGFYGVLSVAARYGCGRSAHGLGCKTSGSALGGLIVRAVIAVVTTVTVVTHDRDGRRIGIAAGLGFIGLAVCFICAQALIATT